MTFLFFFFFFSERQVKCQLSARTGVNLQSLERVDFEKRRAKGEKNGFLNLSLKEGMI